MQIDVFAFVEVQRQKVDADAAAAIRRPLDTRDGSPPRTVGGGDVGEKVARRRGGRGSGRAQRESQGEGAERENSGSRRARFSAAAPEPPGRGASIVSRLDKFFWIWGGGQTPRDSNIKAMSEFRSSRAPG